MIISYKITVVLLNYLLMHCLNTSGQDYSLIEQDKPFKSGKINLLWDKAKRTLSKNDLLRLYEDFFVQDHLEMQIKKEKENNGDENGEREAHIRQKLLNILERYKIVHIYPYEESQVKTISSRAKIKSRISKDTRLIQLWDQVEKGNFNDKELKEMEIEFLHYLDKLDEFNILQIELERLREYSANKIQKDRFDPDPTMDTIQNKNLALKQKHSTMKEVLQQLKDLINSKSKFGNNESTYEYSNKKINSEDWQDPRVMELWRIALKSNFTDVEQQSFKEELNIFSRKIMKQEHYVREAASIKHKTHLPEFNDIYSQLEESVKKQTMKVKKWYKELKSRITNHIYHPEL